MIEKTVSLAVKFWELVTSKDSRVGKLLLGLTMGIPIAVIIILLSFCRVHSSLHIHLRHLIQLTTDFDFRLSTVAIAMILLFFENKALKELGEIGARIHPTFGRKNYLLFGSLFISFAFLFITFAAHHLSFVVAYLIGCNAYINDAGGFFGGWIACKLKYETHLIAKDISEKKSWEAAIFGILLSNIFCNLILYPFLKPNFIISRPAFIFLCLFGSIGAILGDLIESKIKRMADLKDSGQGLASHGGFLDRIDSLLGTAYTYIFWFVYLYLTAPK